MEEITKVLKNLMSFKTIDGNSLEFHKLFEYIKSILPNNLYQTMYEFNNKKSLVISNCKSKNIDLIICTHVDVVYGTDESHDIIFPNNDNIAYISGMATLEKARGMGIGTQLFEYAMNYFKEKAIYDYVYLRTSLYAFMSSGIAKKHGFITLQKDNQIYTQAVQFERIDPTLNDTDLRNFMVKIMNDNVSYSDIKFK